MFLSSRQILVPRTSWGRPTPTSPGRPLKILFDRPGDVPIWRPGDVLKWRPGDVLIWRSRDVPGRLIRDVPRTFSGRPLEDLESTQTWMSKIFLTFLLELIRLTKSKSISTLKVYWEPSKTSKIGAFSAKLVNDFAAVNYFCERTSSQKPGWVFNTSLILSSNVIWHAYRLIAETKIFRLGVSLICLSYVKDEWIGKKV